MKRKTLVVIIVIVIAIALGAWHVLGGKPVPEGAPTQRPEGEGWIDLLDGAHASGWKNVMDDKDIFAIEDGILHIFGHTVHPLRYAVYTSEAFGDFDLHIEFKVAHRANSGVFLRAPRDGSLQRGFEVQVLDDHGKRPTKNSCGAIYDVVTPMFNMSRPRGEWNSYDVTLRGREVTIVMNGWMIVHTDFAKMTKPLGKFKVPYADMPLEGHITLQDHGGEVWYRNILVREH